MFERQLAFRDMAISVCSHQEEYLNVLQSFVPLEQVGVKGSKCAPAIRILLEERSEAPSNAVFDCAQGENIWFFAPQSSAYREVNLAQNTCHVYFTDRSLLTKNAIFHAGFLEPLSYLLKNFGWFPLHGALLRWAGSALLILGRKGAGKSTISLLAMEHGYECLTDEFALLSVDSNSVQGYSFGNRVGVESRSLEHFSLSCDLEWCADRGKHYARSNFASREPLPIERVVFPRFYAESADELTLRELTAKELLSSLALDEYVHLDSRSPVLVSQSKQYFSLLALLSRQARGFELTYGSGRVEDILGVIGLATE